MTDELKTALEAAKKTLVAANVAAWNAGQPYIAESMYATYRDIRDWTERTSANESQTATATVVDLRNDPDIIAWRLTALLREVKKFVDAAGEAVDHPGSSIPEEAGEQALAILQAHRDRLRIWTDIAHELTAEPEISAT